MSTWVDAHLEHDDALIEALAGSIQPAASLICASQGQAVLFGLRPLPVIMGLLPMTPALSPDPACNLN